MKKRSSNRKRAGTIVLGCAVGAAAIIYFGTAIYFRDHFPLGAFLDGISVSGMTLGEAEKALSGKTENYVLTLEGRDSLTDTIRADEIGLTMNLDEQELRNLMHSRSPLRWPETFFVKTCYSSTSVAVCDEAALQQKTESLIFFDSKYVTAPVNAALELSGDTLTIVPEGEGTELDEDRTLDAIHTAVTSLTPSLDLDAAGLYEEPAVRASDPSVKAEAEVKNAILTRFPSLRFGDDLERPDAEEILSWITYKDGAASIDDEKLGDYIASLAAKYDTIGTDRSFEDPGDHRTVTIPAGTFGWQMDQEATLQELQEALAGAETASGAVSGEASAETTESSAADISADPSEEITAASAVSSDLSGGTSRTEAAEQADTADASAAVTADTAEETADGSSADPQIEPVWTQEGKQFGSEDWGSDYVAVDLDNQHVYVVKDDKVVLDSDCVSGKAVVGHNTPDGIFYIFAMAKNAVLKGDGYASPVKNWMPFYHGVGFHDATWRSRFGGKIYITSGSHGCVNLPLSFATKLYDLVEVGTPVLVYGGLNQQEAAEAGYYTYDDHTASDAGTDSSSDAGNADTSESAGTAANASSVDVAAAVQAAQNARAAAEQANQALANAQAGGDPTAIAQAQAQAAQAAAAAVQAQAAAEQAAAAQSAAQAQNGASGASQPQ